MKRIQRERERERFCSRKVVISQERVKGKRSSKFFRHSGPAGGASDYEKNV